MMDYKYFSWKNEKGDDYESKRKFVHQRSAERLLKLCRKNKGWFKLKLRVFFDSQYFFLKKMNSSLFQESIQKLVNM